MISNLQETRPMNARRIWQSAVVSILFAGLGGPGVLPLAAKPKAHSVTLTWNASAPSKDFTVAGYNIYRGTKRGGPYEKIASRVSGLTYVDHTVNRRKTYFYVVTAVDEGGRESKFSQEIKAVIP
jgi:fibronectin type 3 domain-containing protein